MEVNILNSTVFINHKTSVIKRKAESFAVFPFTHPTICYLTLPRAPLAGAPIRAEECVSVSVICGG